MKIDFEQIRSLLATVSQEPDITELTIESGDEKITVKKSSGQLIAQGGSNHVEVSATTHPVPVASGGGNRQTATAPAQTQQQTQAGNNEEQNSNNGLLSITSPMVGTFYRSPSPTAAPFVEAGDHVSVGQTVCIIEAMKLMNDMPSEIAGKVVKILVENGTTVEFGQPLMLVDPNG